MIDKNPNLTIMISATPLNRTGKEPGTGTLSHPFANQTKLYFGLRITRQITGLFKGVATLNSNRSGLTGDFFITKIDSECRDAYDTPTPLTTANPEVAMAQSNIPLPESFNNSQSSESNLDSLPLPVRINLAQRNIDDLMAAIISQMEALADYMRELTALKQGGESNG